MPNADLETALLENERRRRGNGELNIQTIGAPITGEGLRRLLSSFHGPTGDALRVVSDAMGQAPGVMADAARTVAPAVGFGAQTLGSTLGVGPAIPPLDVLTQYSEQSSPSSTSPVFNAKAGDPRDKGSAPSPPPPSQGEAFGGGVVDLSPPSRGSAMSGGVVELPTLAVASAPPPPRPIYRYKTASGEWKDRFTNIPEEQPKETGRSFQEYTPKGSYTPSAPLSSLPSWHPAVQEDAALKEAMAIREANIARAKALTADPFAPEKAGLEKWKAERDYAAGIAERGRLPTAELAARRRLYDTEKGRLIDEYRNALKAIKDQNIGDDAGIAQRSNVASQRVRAALEQLGKKYLGKYIPEEEASVVEAEAGS